MAGTAEAPAPAVTSRVDAGLAPEPGSFRDRNGTVLYRDGRVFRTLSEAARANWERLEKTPFFARERERGRIVETWIAETAPGEGAAMLEHARVPFISYPYEWTFGMLKDAALLHLDLIRAALDADMILKDASPYNVQWRGVNPVFIDIPSFVPLAPGEPWTGYRQFCELMLYPLMLQAYRGVDFRPLLRGRIDGITAAEMRKLTSARDLARPGVLLHVAAQAALQRRYSGSGRDMRGTLAKAGFDKSLIARNVDKLIRIVSGLSAGGSRTEWSDYDRTHSYEAAEMDRKVGFVRDAASSRSWKLAWDLGCNTGTYSRVLEDHADRIVSMDGDWMAIERLYQSEKAGAKSEKILPLVINLADASPNQGWGGAERKGLSERGNPELVLCLALVHHIVISANIPMVAFLDWLSGLGGAIIIEWVDREDEMVRALLANREDQYSDYHYEMFRTLLEERFEIASESSLKDGRRRIFFALPKRSPTRKAPAA